mmetsp:Transcript_22202/g.33824  ORF Transcript_22202/g.33824 Transcript_22202/m.33824 type:complete len:131 (+) Transcript_22202:136-528(+)|eukprot:CAMPEP_0194088236 /NCGR_PEP_ID=MMETSP0149-20130528/28318_1 /TAXON_ID=122233 /ORGANISM="Chaetoceros debilis, Strain MM31A-1" /LENGTH=130 /DNA_ID=CAMNT_0038771839 /DNA_START=73 /DNA_END=465 /DNA_ORIENTATION=-
MTYSDPKFPIVNPSPSVDDCVKSMRVSDYCVVAGTTVATWGYGYVLGKPLRFPTANTAAALGFTFAGFVVLQDTRGRFMGTKENAREVKVYGLHPEQVVINRVGPVDRRFPTITTSINPIKPEPKFDNYD